MYNRLKKIHLTLILGLTFSPSILLAQTAEAAPNIIQRLMTMMPMIAVIFGIFYIMVILPQRKQEQEHKKLIDGLKKGEDVVTVSGIIGKVATVEADAVVLEVAQNTKMRFEKSAVRKKVAA